MNATDLPQAIQDLIGSTGRFSLAEDTFRAWALFEVTRGDLSFLAAMDAPPQEIYDAAVLTGAEALFLLTSAFELPKGEAVLRVLKEQQRQLAKFGEQNHDPVTWNLILAEEIGEAAKELYEMTFNDPEARERLQTELVEVVAVAASFLESLKRNELKTEVQ